MSYTTGPNRDPSLYASRYSYLIIGGVVFAVILLIVAIMRFFQADWIVKFSIFAAAIILLSNIREVIGQPYNNPSETGLLNVMVGGSLFFAWLASITWGIFWIPALGLLIASIPLTIKRTQVYQYYVNVTRQVLQDVFSTKPRHLP